MKHLNEQTEAMAAAITEASHMKGIQWNRVTWYSWWLFIFLLFVVIPSLSFYIGTQYQLTVQTIEESNSAVMMLPQLHRRDIVVISTSTDASGIRCGGFIKDAPTCPANYHCALQPMADLGGTCVRD